MSVKSVYTIISEFILSRKQEGRPLIVGINGVDGSGKTQLAKNLLSLLDQSVCIHIDDFHNPKGYRYRRGEHSPEGYYYDSINYPHFISESLGLIQDAEEYPVKIKSRLWDLKAEKGDNQFVNIDRNNIVLVEGVFLFRPEMARLLDLKIFIECSFDVIIERMKQRDVKGMNSPQALEDYEVKILHKYIPGQKLYFADVFPKSMADVVLDNNDYNAPKITHISA